MKSAQDIRLLKLANILHELFDIEFGNRDFDDLPPYNQVAWIESAEDLLTRMKDEGVM